MKLLMREFSVIGFLFSALLGGANVWAQTPDCMSGNNPMQVDNDRVLQLKKTAPLGQSIRAHVTGQVTRVFPDRNGHAHFEIQIGDQQGQVLEVVYSLSFGAIGTPRIGGQVDTCGDFINSYAPENGYPASPSGALIHWVHRSNGRHESGFVVLDNVLYGYGKGKGNGA